MLITKSEFREELNSPEKRKYNIIFLGMSGLGKTHWSKLLSAKYGFRHLEFDMLIGQSEQFVNLIKNVPGKDEAEKLGNYFGKLWEKEFQSKEDRYLEIERDLMSKEYSPDSILDLTGSAVYHLPQLEKLYKKGLIICLESNEQLQHEMFKSYVANPKPVCWNGIFKKKNNESNEEALARCYVLLLKHRSKLYHKYADIILPYEIKKTLNDAEGFVEEVCKRL